MFQTQIRSILQDGCGKEGNNPLVIEVIGSNPDSYPGIFLENKRMERRFSLIGRI